MNSLTDPTTLEKHRHTMAHILAQAILRIFPDTKLGIGPVVENGFYYEVELGNDKKITHKHFPKIEEEMWSIMKSRFPLRQIVVSKDEAYNLLLHQGQIYKTEILEEIDSEEVSIYKTGEEFLDLCSGPHVENTGQVGFFKLTKIEEGYWKGIPSRPKMQKIFGVGFLQKKDLINYLEDVEKLKQLDHRKMGQNLGYYHINPSTGMGMPLWLPKGNTLKNTIFDFLKAEKKDLEFKEVSTPELMPSSSKLHEITDEEKKNQYFPEVKNEKGKYILRVEKSPQHFQVFKSKTRSYRDLPMKIFEHGKVYREEADSELHGLAKTKSFTAESNTIFCEESQVFPILLEVFQLTAKTLQKFGFVDYKIQLTSNSNNITPRFRWAESVLRKVIKTLKLVSRQIDENSTDNGPKLEFFVKDIFGNEWQISSIQLDVFSTVRQDLKFINQSGNEEEIVVIRSTIIGSVERLIGLILEREKGDLPLWLAPEQIRVLPISEKYVEYGEEIKKQLRGFGYRTEIDKNDETLQYRIKIAQEEKIPYMVIIGSKEESSKSISVRPRDGQDLGLMRMKDFLEILEKAE